MNASEPIAGEIERLLAVEREIEAMLAEAQREAAEIGKEAEAQRAARERELQRTLEEEVAHRRSELLLGVRAEVDRVEREAEAQAARYELAPADVERLAHSMAEVLASGGDP